MIEPEVLTVSPDELLLASWCRGDVSAGNELIKRYLKPLLLYLRSKLSSEEDVQELVQATLAACAEQRQRLAEVASFRAYLFGIARNKLLTLYASRSRSRDVDDLASIPLAALSPGPSTLAKLQQRVDTLLLAMDELSIDQQTAIQLKYWHGMTQQEVAGALAVPVGTAARRIHDATRKLAEAYARLSERGASGRREIPNDHALRRLLASMACRLL